MLEQKAVRGKLWVAFGMETVCTKNVGTLHNQKSVGEISVVGCGKEWQKGTRGDWQKMR